MDNNEKIKQIIIQMIREINSMPLLMRIKSFIENIK